MTPNDPLYSQQWHFDLIGDIETIWDEFDGSGVTVGIYDDGVDYNHADLAENYDANLHIIDPGTGLPVDPFPATAGDAHGTACAGIIAGVGNNNEGGTGVAGGATIAGVNIFDPNSYGYVNASTTAGFLEFIDAIEQGSMFDVMSNSWGSTPAFGQSLADPNSGDYYLQNAYDSVASNGRGGLGTVVVQAAGNDNLDANGDGTNAGRFTITVAATDINGDAQDYTNFGQSVLVAAPAAAVTTDISGADGYDAGDYTTTFGGTSAATPTVSGVIALMMEANDGLGWRDVQNILAMSAVHTGSDITSGVAGGFEDGAWFVNDAGNWNGGGMHFHVNYGYGMVDAFQAVRMAEAWTLFGDAQTSANEVNMTSGATTVNQAIPDDGSYITFDINVTFDMSIEHVGLVLEFDHTYVGDVEILLTSADGTQITVFASPSINTNYDGSWYFGIDSLLGENAFGTWTVSVTDTYSLVDFGNVQSAYLDFYGTAISTDDVYHYTNEVADAVDLDPTRKILTDSNGGEDWINASAISQSLVISLAVNGTGSGSYLGAPEDFIEIANGTIIENVITGDGDDQITGNNFDNEIHGMRGDDTITGAGGNDILVGGAGTNTLLGGQGFDRFIAGKGMDYFDGGANSDVVTYENSTAGITIDLQNAALNTNDADGDTFLSIEKIIATSQADILRGNAVANSFVAGDGDDIIFARGGNDEIFGGNGFDELYGQGGNDRLYGGDDDDLLNGGQGSDILNGGAGIDTASYISSLVGLTVDLQTAVNTGEANGDSYISIENLEGTLHNDILRGNGGDNLIKGSGGNDTIFGRGGADTLQGGIGADHLYGQGGVDILEGGNDNDMLDGGALGDTLNGGTGYDYAVYSSAASGVSASLGSLAVNTGDAAGDSYISIEGLIGSQHNDALYGNGGNNIISGLNGTDNLYGGGGNDTLYGGLGNDYLYGQEGNDTLTGGAGSDGFVFYGTEFEGLDTITDFASGTDTIWLEDSDIFSVIGATLDANEFKDLANGNQDADDFLIYNSATGVLFFDADGLGGDAAIRIANLGAGTALEYSDFDMLILA